MRIVLTFLLGASLFTASACTDSSTAPDGGTDASSDTSTGDGATSCPSGQSHFEPGCGGSSALTAGCYQDCSSSFTCPDGLSCQWAWINPCVCEEGEGCCAACGAETALCVDWVPDTSPYELESLTDLCDGLTGQQVLDMAGGTHTVPFVYADATADTELTMTFTHTGGTITCQPTVRSRPGVGMPDQPPHVELVVDAEVSTADGTFDETITGVTLRLGGFSTEVTHNFAIPLAEIGGSYAPADPDLVDDVRFGGSITESGLMGNAFADGRTAGGAMSTMPIGSWNTL